MPHESVAISNQALSRISQESLSKVFLRPLESIGLVDSTSLPLANTRSGNLFDDRFNKTLKWYIPKYDLAADPDQFFSFQASQSGVDNSGKPFNKGTLSLSLLKSMPDDVQSLKTANPNLQFKEVAILNSTASLSTTSIDSITGQNIQNNYSGKVSPTPNDNLELVFDNIVGAGVIILYNNLQHEGASISISFNYEEWLKNGFIIPPLMLTLSTEQAIASTHVPLAPQMFHMPPLVLNHQVALAPKSVHISSRAVRHFDLEKLIPIHTSATASSGTHIDDEDRFERTTTADSFQFALKKKYAINAYTLKFTISTGGSIARPIINENDLIDFNTKQSEFTELKVLGDIRQKYPSMSRLYIGNLSRSIVVVPSSYSIVRSVHGLSALCQALLDSASESETKCKFQFTFIVAPDVSLIDLLQLSQEISNIEELQEHTITLPNFLKEGTSPKLMSVFQSSIKCSNTADQHDFALSIEIKDQIDDSPAVASANILLGQLCQAQDPFLLATLSLKLDDNFADPVDATTVLNFHKSTATNELTFNIDSNLKTITFLNGSPFDLVVNRYALFGDNNIKIIPANISIKSNESVSVPFDSISGELKVIADCDIDLAGVISRKEIEKFMVFQTQDVQSTKYTFGINGASVNFDTLGISQINILITLNELPNISVPQFSLLKLHPVDGVFALIPIEHAITSLNANILITVQHIDLSKPDVEVNLQHQFVDAPILILQDEDISNIV